MKIKSCGKLSGKCLPDATVQWWVSCDLLPWDKIVASRPCSSLWGYWCVHATSLKEKRKKKHFWNSCELTNHGHVGSKLYSSQSSNTFPLQFQPPVKVKYVKHILFSENLYVSNGEGNGTPLQYSCLENPMDGGAWWAAVHGVAESWTRLSDFTFTFHFHALEKKMATPSSVLAWRIPGTGEPGRLPSMGSHRVGHDWSDLAAAVAAAAGHRIWEVRAGICLKQRVRR